LKAHSNWIVNGLLLSLASTTIGSNTVSGLDCDVEDLYGKIFLPALTTQGRLQWVAQGARPWRCECLSISDAADLWWTKPLYFISILPGFRELFDAGYPESRALAVCRMRQPLNLAIDPTSNPKASPDNRFSPGFFRA
jgi:hypothetical protein